MILVVDFVFGKNNKSWLSLVDYLIKQEKGTMSIKSFWDKCHSTDKVGSLSGCQYDETIDFLKIRDFIKKGTKVLEVGVGLGHVTKGLYDIGVEVSCLEISTVGVKRVEKYCKNTYLLPDMATLPGDYFDVIICNNVVQHVPTEDLVIELKELFRSLKQTGVLAIEFVSTIGAEDTGSNPSLIDIQNGGLCRTPNFMEKIFNSFGGICNMVVAMEVDINIVKGFHVFHVTKIQ